MVSIARKPGKKNPEPAQPLNEYLTQRIFESGLSNTEVATAIGYDKPNVIAMIKQGSMRLPVNKVAPLAKALGIDPVFLLDKVMRQSASELWDGLQAVMGNRLVSENELRLLQFVRDHLKAVDVDLTKLPEFLDPLGQQLDAICAREMALSRAGFELANRKTKPGPRSAGARVTPIGALRDAVINEGHAD